MMTRARYRKAQAILAGQSQKRKVENEDSTTKERTAQPKEAPVLLQPAPLAREPFQEKHPKKDKNNESRKKRKTAKWKKPEGEVFQAAMRPRKSEEGTFYLKDLQIVYASSEAQRPERCVECVNFHKEDIFGDGGENLNMGFPGCCGIYLVPIWTTQRELANVEDPSRQNLYLGFPGVYVYLVPTFLPSVQERIIGLQLFRSRKFNPPRFGWGHTTGNINEQRGGDHLCLQWDLGNEHDVPGHKFRFRFWRR